MFVQLFDEAFGFSHASYKSRRIPRHKKKSKSFIPLRWKSRLHEIKQIFEGKEAPKRALSLGYYGGRDRQRDETTKTIKPLKQRFSSRKERRKIC